MLVSLTSVIVALSAAASVSGHGAMLSPAPWRMPSSFVNKLPGGGQALLKSGENNGQDIPLYLLQSSPLSFFSEKGLGSPRGGAYSLPCRGVDPDGTTHKVTPGGSLRVKYQIDVKHGGDCTFKFFTGRPGSHKQIGSTKTIKGCGQRVNGGVYTTLSVPSEAAGCGGSKFCFVQFFWETDGHDNGGDPQLYCNCATVVAGGKSSRRRRLAERRAQVE